MAGNWKMYKTAAETTAFFEKFAPLVEQSGHADAVICPTFVNIPAAVAATQGTRIEIGGQNLYWKNEGAFTGEISGPMLKAAGARWVIVGHSERRQYHGEDDALINAKVKAAYKHGLVPIMCIGEVKEEREAGIQEQVTLGQLDGGLADIPADQAKTIVIAYEPVWAIGTGLTATPQDAQDMCGEIRRRLSELYSQEVADAIRIQYGGSVKAANAAEIMAGPDVDGALIGGASLDADEFVAICKYRLS